MVSSDTVVGIVGAIILTGAMIAVFYYEADRDPSSAPGDIGMGSELFHYRYVERGDHEIVDQEERTLTQGQSQDYPLEVPAYAFMIHVEVNWREHELAPLVGEPTFTIELLDRDNDDEVIADTDAGTDASPLHHEPGDDKAAPDQMNFTVAANSSDQAQGFVEDHMSSPEVRANVRNWTVRVTLVNDGIDVDDPLETIGQERVYDITVKVSHYVPQPRENAQ